MKKNIFAFAAFLLGLTACVGKGKFAETERLVTDSIGVERTDSVCRVKISVAYPTQGPAPLLDSLRCFIANVLLDEAVFESVNAADNLSATGQAFPADGETLLTAAAGRTYDRLKADRDAMLNSFEDGVAAASWPAYESDCDISLLHETDAYVTFSVMRYEFLGGAHGSTFVSATTFLKTDGRQMGWSLFRDTDSPAFQRLIRDGVRQYFQDAVGNPVSDEELGDLLLLAPEAKQIPLPAVAPYFTAEGVAFVYQQYEIAPYAAGMPTFTVPFADIRPFLSSAAESLLPKD